MVMILAFFFLGEQLTWKVGLGGLFIGLGAMLMAM
jgi:uncharacterized membrane protein